MPWTLLTMVHCRDDDLHDINHNWQSYRIQMDVPDCGMDGAPTVVHMPDADLGGIHYK